MRGGRELRKAMRVQRRSPASILLDGGQSPISCVLWDISEVGARISAPHAASLPSVFALSAAKGHKQNYFCEVVWRKNGQIGVCFIDEVSADIDLNPRHPHLRRAVALTSSTAAPKTSPTSKLDANRLLLPGCGPHLSRAPATTTFSISSMAFVMLALLLGATALFTFAGMHSDAAWTRELCDSTSNFCQHPEWTGGAAAMMTVIYLTVRGMER
jgi:hypothetical protein